MRIMADNKNIIFAEKIRKCFRNICSRILFISPMLIPENNFDIDIARSGRYTIFPPYGLGILSNKLCARGYTTEIIDLCFVILSHANEADKQFKYDIWKDELKECLQNFKPDLVGITCMFSMENEQLKIISDFIKEYNKEHNKNISVVAGGVHVSTATETILRYCKNVDFAFLYESDRSFPDTLDFINGKIHEDNLTQIATLVDDKYIFIEKRSTPNEADINISPNYCNLELWKYSQLGKIGAYAPWLLSESVRSTHIISNRGCRGNCTFCSVRNIYGKGVRQRDIISIVDEMEDLKSKYGITHFVWLDDDLLYNKKRIINLFDEIYKRNLSITWDASNGVVAASITSELMDSAVKSGCIGISLGIESGNPDILMGMHKPSNIKNYIEASKILRNYPQLFIRGFLMIGFPNETIDQIQDTVKLAIEMNLDWYNINPVIPFISTKIWESLNEQLNNTNLNELKYYSGDTGQQKSRENEEKLVSKNFKDIFSQDLYHIPTKDELQDIWFIVEYKVNYERILSENRLVKLEMLEKHLRYICDRAYKNNAIGNLFLGIVEQKIGNIQESVKRMSLAKKYVNDSSYWSKRFEVLDLYKLFI